MILVNIRLRGCWVMDITFLPCFVNDAVCALDDVDYEKVENIMAEAQPLINKAESAAGKLAGAIHTWSKSIVDDGISAEIEIYVKFIKDDSAELQKITDLLLGIYSFTEVLKNNVSYQNWRRKAAWGEIA